MARLTNNKASHQIRRSRMGLERLEDRAVPAYTATLVGTTATFTGDATGDTLAFSLAGPLLQHNRFTAGDPGFNSDLDFDTAVAGDQNLTAATAVVNVNAGDGDDTIALADGVVLNGAVDGEGGTDTLDYSAYTTPVAVNLGRQRPGPDRHPGRRPGGAADVQHRHRHVPRSLTTTSPTRSTSP